MESHYEKSMADEEQQRQEKVLGQMSVVGGVWLRFRFPPQHKDACLNGRHGTLKSVDGEWAWVDWGRGINESVALADLRTSDGIQGPPRLLPTRKHYVHIGSRLFCS